MNNLKKQKMWLSIVLIFTICLFALGLFFLLVWIPNAVQAQYGEPGSELSKHGEIFLNIKLFFRSDKLSSANNLVNEAKTFYVEPGKTAGQIAEELQDSGLITDADGLIAYWEYKGYDRLIRDGVYLIPANASVLTIGKNLVQGETGYTKFAFLPGWRKEEIDSLLVTSGLIQNPEAILIQDCHPEIKSEFVEIEGFLSPGEYQVPEEFSTREIYCMFSETFFSTLPEGFLESIGIQGLNLEEMVALASIVEKEMVCDAEAKRIAGVFVNRLRADMPLQSDPTIQYAIASENGGPPWWSPEISASDLEINSPYNTYLNTGLPPGPICNPGLVALQSVLNPEEHDYFYFRAACDQSGMHTFSETYEQHLDAACD